MSIEFLATSLVVVVAPGTGVIYTVSSALSGGLRRGWVAAIGCTLGIVPHLLAAMLGLSSLMQAGAVAFEIVRWAGVAYLAYMGLSMLRHGGELPVGDPDHEADTSTHTTAIVVRRGIVLNLLNPKLTVFFFAFLPQFLERAPAPLDPALLVLATVFMLMTLVVFAGYALASAAFREHFVRRPRVRQWLQRTLGGLLLAFAARLAIEDR